MLNDQPDLEGIRTICEAHARLGTTGLLPTLITDTPEVTRAAVEAGVAAAAAGVPGSSGCTSRARTSTRGARGRTTRR